MKIQLYNRKQEKAYTIPVGSGSTYTWKKQEEEYVTVKFSSDTVLALKKGFYTEMEGLGRFEVVDLPTPTKSSKDIGYDYELRLDRPWYRFKNRIIFFRRGSVSGMESKWSLTDTLAAHAGILTDNLASTGCTYGGQDYVVYIHDDVEKRNEAKLIAYDSTTLLSAIDKMADTFDTEWWIEGNIINFGRCEQGDKYIPLEQGRELNGLSRSEDSEQHGTRLYAFGSSRNLNQNYRRKLKNPFTIDGFHKLYGTTVRFTTDMPTKAYSANMRIKITDGSDYAGQTFTFKVVSGTYTHVYAGFVLWFDPVFEIEVPTATEAIGFKVGTEVQFIIGDETDEQTDASKTRMTSVTRESSQIFSFKDLQLPKKAITKNSTITLEDGTTVGIEYIGIASDHGTVVNDGRDCYSLSDKTITLSGSTQQVSLARLAMAYVNKLYTEPIDGQSEVAIQGVADTILQLPMGTPYIDSTPNLDPSDITDIVKTYEDIYPRALLTITEVTEVQAKTTDTDTGDVTYWTAYRFKAKLQDGSPFVFDSIYETQDDSKVLSIHFESGKLNGMDFEVHFNPDADVDDNQLFEITRNDTYTLELPNETMKPAVGDTLYMYNMDITFIDDALVEAAENELKAEAEKDMEKMKADSGTYTVTKNPVLFGQKGIELTYGSKVRLVAPEYFTAEEDHARESRIIGWELDLEDLTQGELAIGESAHTSNSESLAETVSEIVYMNDQIQTQQELQTTKIKSLIETIAGKKYLSKLNDDTAAGNLAFQGTTTHQGAATFESEATFQQGLTATHATIGSNFAFYSDSPFAFDSGGNIIAHSVTSDTYDEAKGQGFLIAVRDVETGKYKMNLDQLTAWGLATLGQLHVKGDARMGGDSVFDGTLSSPGFISGFLDGTGWRLKNQPVTNAAGVLENKYTMELDNLIVRGTMRVYEMAISQLLGENDNRIFTAMMEVDHYDAESGRVYLDTKDGQRYNPFREGDYIMVAQYNGLPTADNDNYVTKQYELLITGVGMEGSGEDSLAWVTFMNFTTSIEGGTAATLIRQKDTFVRVDNVSDPDRKGIIQMMTMGTDTPYMDIVYGLKTDPENALKGRLGNLEGIVHPLFGSLSGFGEYLNNLYATGDFVLRRTGESVDTKIQMLQNQFATRFAQTTYDISEETNFLHNGQFLTVLGEEDSEVIDGWTVDAADETVFWVDDEGAPVMVNNGVTTSGNRRVGIDNVEGRNTLRIQDCGLTQANSLVRQPGTHREYTEPSGDATSDGYKDVQDTLYVAALIYAKTAGTLTMGFENCSTVGGKENDLAAQDFAVPYSGDWTKVRMEGKWNGTGSFRLAYTGDILVSLVTLTTEPLDNLSKEVSTQIVQTASNIKLLGENIDNVEGSVTQLGIDLDSANKKITQYVSTAQTKEEAEAQKKALEKAMANNLSTAKTYADGVGNGIKSDYGKTITLVQSNSSSWSVAAGQFDSKGKLKKTAGVVLTTDLAGLSAQKLDKDGNVDVSATITASIEKGISSATIEADKINLTGKTMTFKSGQIIIDSTNFKLDSTGKVTATSGSFTGTINATSGSFTGSINATSGKIGLWSIGVKDGAPSGLMTTDKVKDVSTITKYSEYGLGYANFSGYSGSVTIAVAGGSSSRGIDVEGNANQMTDGVYVSVTREKANGINVVTSGSDSTGIRVSAGATNAALNLVSGVVSGFRLPVVSSTSTINTSDFSPGSNMVFLKNYSSVQTVNLPTPTSVFKGSVIIIMPGTRGDAIIKGKINRGGYAISQVSLSDYTPAYCICDGSYWYVFWMNLAS